MYANKTDDDCNNGVPPPPADRSVCQERGRGEVEPTQ